jgi:hypothetical protein
MQKLAKTFIKKTITKIPNKCQNIEKKTQKHLYTQLNQCQDIQTNAKTLQKCTLASKNRIASNPLKGKFIPSALFSLKFIQRKLHDIA